MSCEAASIARYQTAPDGPLAPEPVGTGACGAGTRSSVAKPGGGWSGTAALKLDGTWFPSAGEQAARPAAQSVNIEVRQARAARRDGAIPSPGAVLKSRRLLGGHGRISVGL